MLSWRSPNVDEMALATFAEKGLVPPKEVAHWRVPYVAGFITVCEAFIGMEPYVDSFWRVLSEGKMLRTALVRGFALVARWAVSLPRSCLDCMRRSRAPCSSAEHLWV